MAIADGRLVCVRFEQPHPNHAHATLLCRAIAHPAGYWMIGLVAPGGQPSAWILKADWPAEAPRAAASSPDRIARLIPRLLGFLKARCAVECGHHNSRAGGYRSSVGETLVCRSCRPA